MKREKIKFKKKKEGKTLQAKEGCEKGLVRSHPILGRSTSEGSAVLFLLRLPGDAVQGAAPAHGVFPPSL